MGGFYAIWDHVIGQTVETHSKKRSPPPPPPHTHTQNARVHFLQNRSGPIAERPPNMRNHRFWRVKTRGQDVANNSLQETHRRSISIHNFRPMEVHPLTGRGVLYRTAGGMVQRTAQRKGGAGWCQKWQRCGQPSTAGAAVGTGTACGLSCGTRGPTCPPQHCPIPSNVTEGANGTPGGGVSRAWTARRRSQGPSCPVHRRTSNGAPGKEAHARGRVEERVGGQQVLDQR